MTLKELAALVTGEKLDHTVRASELLKMNSLVIAKGIHDTGEVTVFQNGYILYTEDNHLTVFHLSDVLGKTVYYKTTHSKIIPEEQRQLEISFFEDLDWLIRIVMYGNGKIVHNCNSILDQKIEFRFAVMPDNHIDMVYIPEYLTDEADNREQQKQLIEAVKVRIVPTQWLVFVNKAGFGMTEAQLGKKLNISQQAVGKRYRKALKNIAKAKEEVKRFSDKME